MNDSEARAAAISDEHRRQFCIQTLDSYRTFMRRHPAGFHGALITMAAGLGRLTNDPPDISALADLLMLSRTTVMRKLGVLERAGMIRMNKAGRRVLVESTFDLGSEEGSWPLADRLILEGRRRLKE